MSNVGVISLGCAKNQVDTERMLGLLTNAGHTLTGDPAEADILIVNTCGFIEPAKQESIDAILEMAQYKKTGKCRAARGNRLPVRALSRGTQKRVAGDRHPARRTRI